MTHERRRNIIRKKLLNLLERHKLEELSERQRPWILSRAELLNAALGNWNADEVRFHVEILLRDAQ